MAQLSTLDLWFVVLLCSAATYLWRFLGVVVSKHIDVTSAVFEWVTCVSYAMVAGLVCRLLVLPENELAVIPLGWRVLAIVAAFASFYLFRKSMLAGVLVGSGALVGVVYVGGY